MKRFCVRKFINFEALPSARHQKRRCEITIISFSRSICRRGLVALIGVTGKPYPSCLSCHSHPIRPCGAPSPRGEGCDTRIPSSKKRRRSRHLNPEPNESKAKRSCEEMRIHFFTAPFLMLLCLHATNFFFPRPPHCRGALSALLRLLRKSRHRIWAPCGSPALKI